MSPPNTIDGKKRDNILAMLARRPVVPISEIAKFYGVGAETVRRIAEVNKVSLRGRAG